MVTTIADLPVGPGLSTPPPATYIDLVAAGIIDPVKVTRSAVDNAASIAGMVLTTQSTVVDVPEEKKQDAGNHGHRH